MDLKTISAEIVNELFALAGIQIGDDNRTKLFRDCDEKVLSKLQQIASSIAKKKLKLTESEVIIIEGIRDGKMAKEISGDVHLTTRTVETVIGRIKEKLGAKTIAQVVTKAYSLGIIEIEKQEIENGGL